MLKKNRSCRLFKLKVLLVLPLVALLLITFSCNNSTDKSKSKDSAVSQKNEKTDTATVKMPEFPGGQEALYSWLSKNIKYPDAAKKRKIEGKVFVNFTVSKTGKIDKVSILKKINDLLDAEAVRVVSSMPNWTPGENKDIPVDVEMTLPINFKLD